LPARSSPPPRVPYFYHNWGMPMPKLLLLLTCAPLFAQDMGEAELRALVAKSPRLSLQQTELRIQPPAAGWAPEVVSSVAIDENGVIYVADRENGRIQRFDLQGKYIGEWANLGKTFSLRFNEGALWIGTQPRNKPNGAPGWLMKLDRRTGAVLGYVESTG